MIRRAFNVLMIITVEVGSSCYAAEPTPVRLDAKCPDKTIEYDLNRHAISEIQANKSFKLVSDGTAEAVIRISGAPVKVKASDAAPPLGISLATLVTRKNASGSWDIKKFDNAFVPIDGIEKKIKDTVKDALK
jgi:hypothetical protein